MCLAHTILGLSATESRVYLLCLQQTEGAGLAGKMRRKTGAGEGGGGVEKWGTAAGEGNSAQKTTTMSTVDGCSLAIHVQRGVCKIFALINSHSHHVCVCVCVGELVSVSVCLGLLPFHENTHSGYLAGGNSEIRKYSPINMIK